MKSSNLRQSRACSQNKQLSEYQRRAERQEGNSQSQKARGNFGLRNGILHQTGRRLPVANHVFLGSWTVDVFLIFNFFITPLISIFITYYYLAKKKTLFLKQISCMYVCDLFCIFNIVLLRV